MTTSLPIPVDRYLVPGDEAVVLPEDAVRVRQGLVRGLPATFSLEGDLSLVLYVPTGNAQLWRNAGGTEVIAVASEETTPHSSEDLEDPAARPAPRLVLRRGAASIAAVPLRAALSRRLPDDGVSGAMLDLWVLDYALHAGTMREPGDFGSFIEFAWRRIDRGSNSFALPQLDARVAERLTERIEAQAGAGP